MRMFVRFFIGQTWMIMKKQLQNRKCQVQSYKSDKSHHKDEGKQCYLSNMRDIIRVERINLIRLLYPAIR